ncbi:hypothetical protein [Tenacibaculum aestuariivivum]|uniref:hypothetical protein n=1 Tax=Tenacibaculum aestuariivivum TaxID=2006131 RepID=UPI003AB3E356
MIHYNKYIFILFSALIFISLKINAQEVRIIDNKGTIKTVNNNNVTSGNTEPTAPVEGDVWFDTLNSEIKVYDADPIPIGTWRNIASSSSTGDNIYNINGTLTQNRTLNGGGNQLFFNNLDWFQISNTNFIRIQSDGFLDFIGPSGINLYSDTRLTGNISVSGGYRDSTNSFGTANQILSSTVTGTQWVDNIGTTGTTGAVFFAGTDGNITENNSQLFWDISNNRFGIGTNSPTNKLHVSGAIRAQGILNSDGTLTEPSYRFNDDTNTGIFRPAADEIGLVVGGYEAINIDETSNATKVTINETIELNGPLVDINNTTGTAEQILSSTVTGTQWVDKPGSTWLAKNDNLTADKNDTEIYKNGTVGIGDFSGATTIDAQLHVKSTNVPFKIQPNTTTPTGTSTGQMFVDSTNGILYIFDGTRNKWLSVDRTMVGWGRNNDNTTNEYLRQFNGAQSNNNGWRMIRNGTITAISAQTNINQNWTLEIRKNDAPAVITSITMTTQGNHNNTINVNINEGDYIQAYCNGTSIDYPEVLIEIAWRK